MLTVDGKKKRLNTCVEIEYEVKLKGEQKQRSFS